MRKETFDRSKAVFFIVFAFVFMILMFGVADNCEGSRYKKGQQVCPDPVTTCEGVPVPVMVKECDDAVVSHKYYSLSYNEGCECANWVMYTLTREMVEGNLKRKDNFREDECVKTGSAKPADYSRSGYDKGHLCPAADMLFDKDAADETFYMSNICPQKHKFNAGIWLDIEKDVREFAKRKDSVYVITGPVLSEGLGTIGKYNKVAVPEYFYKVVYCKRFNKAIAFLVPQNLTYKNKGKASDYVVSVDDVENVTGINFLKGVENEASIEISKGDYEWWKM